MGTACGKGAPYAPGSQSWTSTTLNPPRPHTKSDGSDIGEVRSPIGTRGHLVHKHAVSVREVYELENTNIGEGAFGCVCRGRHKLTGMVLAIKTLPRGTVRNQEAVAKEIETMKAMDHPHIIQLFEIFEDRHCIYLAMELCNGGELFDRIIKAGKFTECQAATIMQQMLQAVLHMHSRCIVHRDLKPENFLFLLDAPIEENSLKLIDFGLARTFVHGKPLKSKVGTTFYMSPQVVLGRYDQSCDLWSVGAVMYVLLSGRTPFSGRSDTEVLKKVRVGRWAFQGKCWEGISAEAKDLINSLMQFNPKARLNAEGALSHSWIKDKAPRASDTAIQDDVIDRLRQMRACNQLKKAAMEIVASQLSDDKIRELRHAFAALDDNGDGELTVKELSEGLTKAGLDISALDAQRIVEQVDTNGSGAIDYTEFLAATLDRKNVLTEEVLWSAFRFFDQNGDGKISPSELSRALCHQGGPLGRCSERVKAILAEVDKDGDGYIDFKEFSAMMRAMPGASGPGTGTTPKEARPGARRMPSWKGVAGAAGRGGG